MTNKPRIFISRSIKADSPLLSLNDVADLRGHSLLKIQKVALETALPETDWLFFYSANGVRYLMEQIDIRLIDDYKVAVMGSGTAAAYIEYSGGRLPDYTGSGKPEDAIEFFEKHTNETLTFVKGVNSKESVERRLNPARVEECTVYHNQIDNTATIPDADIYIFTSPMNVEAYMKVACCRFNTRIIAIGDTTNKKLMEYGFMLASMPEEPSEASIVKLLKTMI